ncbi:MAG: DUF1559 domain-containing protein [Fuerstiella sp.]
MQSRRTTRSSAIRRGFTLIELLVVISIIAVLMSLILPAVQNAREAGRRTQCLNNIRNVTLAAMNFASSNKSRLPALGYFPSDDALVAAGGTATGSGRINGRSWAVEMLPFMDQQGTFDRWEKDLPFDGAVNLPLASNLFVEAFACPNDESAFQVQGGLSYVANAGFGTNAAAGDVSNDEGAVQHSPLAEPFNWDGDGDTISFGSVADAQDSDITRATGVFWPEFAGISSTRNSSASIGKIYDGSGNTLMFGENINAGGTNFADPRTRAIGFIFPVDGTAVMAGSLNDATTIIQTGALAYPNDAKAGPEGSSPYLNSNHPGIVVVSFCDGAARTLSEDIDNGVYTQLITPDGTRLRRAASGTAMAVEDPVSADSF